VGFKVGDRVEFKAKITDQMVRDFSEVSGDKNPIHLDDEYAKTTRFGRRIAHGMISAALISRGLAMDLGPGGIYLGQTLKFMNPIFIDEEITVILTVTNMRDKGFTIVETIVRKDTGEIAVKGEATILAPEFV
jgi:acyl dehydratase